MLQVRREDLIDRIGPRAVVAAILIYIGALFALRLALSPFLEIDEAQFVGAVDLRFVYGNSHPPLYNWLVRSALELTGWNWALSVALVRAGLLAATYLLVFDTARRLAGKEAGVVALAAAAFMPQLSWMSAHTLAHSLLVTAAAAGVAHALTLIALRPSAGRFLWLGVAAAIGMLGKYNIALLLVPLAVAALAEPVLRRRFATASAWLAPLAFAILSGPALVAAAMQPHASTERLEKLYDAGPFSAIDVPYIGLDGVLSLALSTLASCGIVLALVLLFARHAPPLATRVEAVRRALWRAIAIGLGAFALVALASDLSLVHERYLTPLLMPLPVLAGLHLSSWRRRSVMVAAGMVAFLAVPFGIVGMVTVDNHRFARPYDAAAAAISPALPPGRVAVAASVQDLAANITLALRRAGFDAAVLDDPLAAPAPTLVRLRSGTGPWPGGTPVAPEGMCEAAITRADIPLPNFSGKSLAVTAVVDTAC